MNAMWKLLAPFVLLITLLLGAYAAPSFGGQVTTCHADNFGVVHCTTRITHPPVLPSAQSHHRARTIWYHSVNSGVYFASDGANNRSFSHTNTLSKFGSVNLQYYVKSNTSWWGVYGTKCTMTFKLKNLVGDVLWSFTKSATTPHKIGEPEDVAKSSVRRGSFNDSASWYALEWPSFTQLSITIDDHMYSGHNPDLSPHSPTGNTYIIAGLQSSHDCLGAVRVTQ